MQTQTVSISQNTPIRLNDLPQLLAPYAQTAPIYVYMLAGGMIQTTRFRLREEADLLLVLAPRGTVS
jgi:hypothetical protein